MIRRLVSAVLASSLILSVASTGAAETAFLTLKGQKSGDVKGSVMQQGRENSIQVVAVAHSVVSPRDLATGAASGKRQHKPFVITKVLDKSSPILESMLATNENIPTLTLKIWASDSRDPRAAERPIYTIALANANIASIEFRMTKVDGKDVVLEEVAFTYQKISWTWADGGISASDDWATSR